MGRKRHEWDRKNTNVEIKDVDVAKGIIVGVPSVFGVVDDGGDRVLPGSFAKTLGDNSLSMARIKLGYQHDLDYPFGISLTGEEIGRDALPESIRSKYAEATGGLQMIGKVKPMNDRNRERLEYVDSGVVNGSSFAYDVIDAGFSAGGEGETVRDLKQLRLHEWGPVTIGMNPAAAITDVKAAIASMTPMDAIGFLTDQVARLQAGIKAGRTLSAANFARVEAAITVLSELLAAAQPAEDTEKSGETTADSAVPEPTDALRDEMTLKLQRAAIRARLRDAVGA